MKVDRQHNDDDDDSEGYSSILSESSISHRPTEEHCLKLQLSLIVNRAFGFRNKQVSKGK